MGNAHTPIKTINIWGVNLEENEQNKQVSKHKHKSKHSNKRHKDEEEVTISKAAVWQILCVLLVIALVVVIMLKPQGGSSKGLGEEEIKTKTLDYVNNNLLQPGITATISSIEKDNGLYKMVIEVQGQQINSYMTADGKVFFPQGLVIEKTAAAPTAPTAQAPPPDVPKSDKPAVELFVMSHCPYGTQIEKGMLPVVDLLGDKADIQVKFVNYAMHGKKEVDEELFQYCIKQEYPGQYFKYLQCFLNEGNTAECTKELGFDTNKLSDCTSKTDEEFGISADFADKSTWSGGRYPRFAIYDEKNKEYGVRGSPTLVINGKSVSSSRDSNSLKNAICNAFNKAPEECEQSLPTASPSPGFGFGTSTTDSAAAGCGV